MSIEYKVNVAGSFSTREIELRMEQNDRLLFGAAMGTRAALKLSDQLREAAYALMSSAELHAYAESLSGQ